MKTRTIAVDFDGVIHAYSKGWQDGSIYDDPVKGAFGALEHMLGHPELTVVIFTARTDLKAVQEWMARQAPEIPTEIMPPTERFWNKRAIVGITNVKPVADFYIDDRGIEFDGNWTWTMIILKYQLQRKGV